jgi:hypothetical protein
MHIGTIHGLAVVERVHGTNERVLKAGAREEAIGRPAIAFRPIKSASTARHEQLRWDNVSVHQLEHAISTAEADGVHALGPSQEFARGIGLVRAA